MYEKNWAPNSRLTRVILFAGLAVDSFGSLILISALASDHDHANRTILLQPMPNLTWIPVTPQRRSGSGATLGSERVCFWVRLTFIKSFFFNLFDTKMGLFGEILPNRAEQYTMPSWSRPSHLDV